MRRLLLLACVVTFADTMFYAAIAPLLPAYVDELDLSKAQAGILAGAYPAGTFIAAIPGGLLAGRVGVKPIALIGMSAMAVSSAVFAWGESLEVLAGARFVAGVGGACTWAAMLGWLMTAAPPDRRGELLGTALGAAM